MLIFVFSSGQLLRMTIKNYIPGYNCKFWTLKISTSFFKFFNSLNSSGFWVQIMKFILITWIDVCMEQHWGPMYHIYFQDLKEIERHDLHRWIFICIYWCVWFNGLKKYFFNFRVLCRNLILMQQKQSMLLSMVSSSSKSKIIMIPIQIDYVYINIY